MQPSQPSAPPSAEHEGFDDEQLDQPQRLPPQLEDDEEQSELAKLQTGHRILLTKHNALLRLHKQTEARLEEQPVEQSEEVAVLLQQQKSLGVSWKHTELSRAYEQEEAEVDEATTSLPNNDSVWKGLVDKAVLAEKRGYKLQLERAVETMGEEHEQERELQAEEEREDVAENEPDEREVGEADKAEEKHTKGSESAQARNDNDNHKMREIKRKAQYNAKPHPLHHAADILASLDGSTKALRAAPSTTELLKQGQLDKGQLLDQQHESGEELGSTTEELTRAVQQRGHWEAHYEQPRETHSSVLPELQRVRQHGQNGSRRAAAGGTISSLPHRQRSTPSAHDIEEGSDRHGLEGHHNPVSATYSTSAPTSSTSTSSVALASPPSASVASASCCAVKEQEIVRLRRRLKEVEEQSGVALRKRDEHVTELTERSEQHIAALTEQVGRLEEQLDSDDFLFQQLDQRCERVYRRFGDKAGFDPPAVFTHYYEQCMDGRCDDDASFLDEVRKRLPDAGDIYDFQKLLCGKLRRPFKDELVIYAYTIRHVPDSTFKALRDAERRVGVLERAAEKLNDGKNSDNKRHRAAISPSLGKADKHDTRVVVCACTASSELTTLRESVKTLEEVSAQQRQEIVRLTEKQHDTHISILQGYVLRACQEFAWDCSFWRQHEVELPADMSVERMYRVLNCVHHFTALCSKLSDYPHYAVSDVSTREEVHKVYSKLSLLLHPDELKARGIDGADRGKRHHTTWSGELHLSSASPRHSPLVPCRSETVLLLAGSAINVLLECHERHQNVAILREKARAEAEAATAADDLLYAQRQWDEELSRQVEAERAQQREEERERARQLERQHLEQLDRMVEEPDHLAEQQVEEGRVAMAEDEPDEQEQEQERAAEEVVGNKEEEDESAQPCDYDDGEAQEIKPTAQSQVMPRLLEHGESVHAHVQPLRSKDHVEQHHRDAAGDEYDGSADVLGADVERHGGNSNGSNGSNSSNGSETDAGRHDSHHRSQQASDVCKKRRHKWDEHERSSSFKRRQYPGTLLIDRSDTTWAPYIAQSRPAAVVHPLSRCVWVQTLSAGCEPLNHTDVGLIFSHFGHVARVDTPWPRSGVRPFAYVHFADEDGARTALERAKDGWLHGLTVTPHWPSPPYSDCRRAEQMQSADRVMRRT